MENKTAGHTPGPWHTEDVTFYSPIAKDKEWVEIWTRGPDGGKQNIVALSGYGEEGFELKTQKANARLIAAAPDMAGEIRKQIGWLKHARAECSGLIRGSLLTGFDQSIKYLTAVLAKAEGR